MLIGVIAEELLLPLVASTGRFVDGPFNGLFGPDTFYRPRLSVVGFVMPGLVDETDVLFGKESLYQTYVTDGYLGIWPDLLDDTVPEIFYPPSRSSQPVLGPSRWIDFDFIYTPIIPIIPPIAPARFTDTDTFFAPAFRASIAPSLIGDDDIIRAQVIWRVGDPFVFLLTETVDDADTIFAASTARGVSPGLFTDTDIIYGGAQIATLLSPAFNSSDLFLAPFIFNQVQPGMVADGDTFIGPTVRTPGRFGLFVDDDIFFVPNMQFAPLLPSLLLDTDMFATHVIASNPALWPFDPVVDVEDTFYAPTVFFAQQLAPHLWIDIDPVYSVPSVALGQPVFPGLYSDIDAIPAIGIASIDIFLSGIFDDTDAIFTGAIGTQTVTAGIFTDTDTAFAPFVFTRLNPSIVTATDAILAPTITAAGFDGALSIDGPIMPSVPQPTVILVES